MPEKQTLSKTQKNEIFNILQDAGLEPSDFSWLEEEGEYLDIVVSKLVYRDEEFYFKFDLNEEGENEPLSCAFSPGINMLSESYAVESWIEQKRFVENWANILRNEIFAPDMWQELEKYKDTFSLAPSEKIIDDQIPYYEVEQITEALHLLAKKIEEQFKLTSEQNEFVRSRIDYLVDAVKRQGRFTWVHTCIGILMGIALKLALPPEDASLLWQLAKSVLGKFIHMLGP
jgi:hypothetical protein